MGNFNTEALAAIKKENPHLASVADGAAPGCAGTFPERFSPLDYGADPLWKKDSTAAFQSTINAAADNGAVIIPAGRFKIGGTLQVKGNLEIRGAGLASILAPSHTAGNHVPLFASTYQHYNFAARNFLIDYSACSGSGSYPSPNINDLAWDLPEWGAFSTWDSIRIENAYKAFRLQGQWMSHFKNVSWWYCKYGMDTGPCGTTLVFDSCWGRGGADVPGHETDCVEAWHIYRGINYVLNSCGFDNYRAARGANFQEATGLTLNGWHLELDRTTGVDPADECLVFFDNCQGVSINGVWTTFCDVISPNKTGRLDAFIRIKNGHGTINGFDIGEAKFNNLAGDEWLDDFITGGGANNPAVASITFMGTRPRWQIAGSRIYPASGNKSGKPTFTGTRYSIANKASGGRIVLAAVDYPAGTVLDSAGLIHEV